jgi:hypothetical protein
MLGSLPPPVIHTGFFPMMVVAPFCSPGGHVGSFWSKKHDFKGHHFAYNFPFVPGMAKMCYKRSV